MVTGRGGVKAFAQHLKRKIYPSQWGGDSEVGLDTWDISDTDDYPPIGCHPRRKGRTTALAGAARWLCVRHADCQARFGHLQRRFPLHFDLRTLLHVDCHGHAQVAHHGEQCNDGLLYR